MSLDAPSLIAQAMQRGETAGLAALDARDAVVYAISEAEVTCDLEGIDSLLDRYGIEGLGVFAHAYAQVRATAIAESLRALMAAPRPPADDLLARANDLITRREGYSYGDILAFVARGD